MASGNGPYSSNHADGQHAFNLHSSSPSSPRDRLNRAGGDQFDRSVTHDRVRRRRIHATTLMLTTLSSIHIQPSLLATPTMVKALGKVIHLFRVESCASLTYMPFPGPTEPRTTPYSSVMIITLALDALNILALTGTSPLW